jgi:uncharacterized protein YggE
MRLVKLLAITLILAACGRAPADPRGVDRDETLLTVTASGRADSRPDEAHLQLGVQSQGASAGEASRLNRDKMARVTEALSRLGAKPDDLQTRNLSLSRIDYGKERGQFRAYNVVEVTLRDMSKIGEAVTSVTEAGANVMSGPNLRVSDREAANQSAYAAAYRAARARADAYAGAAGLTIARVLAIRDGGESNIVAMDAAGMAAETAAPPTMQMSAPPAPFNAGRNTTEVQVRVDFALKQK